MGISNQDLEDGAGMEPGHPDGRGQAASSIICCPPALLAPPWDPLVSHACRTLATSPSEVPRTCLGLSVDLRECTRPNLAERNLARASAAHGRCPGTNFLADRVKDFSCRQPHPLLGHGGRGVQRKGQPLVSLLAAKASVDEPQSPHL